MHAESYSLVVERVLATEHPMQRGVTQAPPHMRYVRGNGH